MPAAAPEPARGRPTIEPLKLSTGERTSARPLAPSKSAIGPLSAPAAAWPNAASAPPAAEPYEPKNRPPHERNPRRSAALEFAASRKTGNCVEGVVDDANSPAASGPCGRGAAAPATVELLGVRMLTPAAPSGKLCVKTKAFVALSSANETVSSTDPLLALYRTSYPPLPSLLGPAPRRVSAAGSAAGGRPDAWPA
jgi:hypothetical protein